MNDTFFFSHDYNSRSDPKIKKLLLKLGMEGYGIWWSIIEDLYQNTNVLPTDYDSIAYELHTDCEKIKSVINDFNLFEINDGFFSSNSVEKRLRERIEKSEKARESVNKRWSKARELYERNTNVLQPNYDSDTTVIQGKERKGNKEKEIHKEKEAHAQTFFNTEDVPIKPKTKRTKKVNDKPFNTPEDFYEYQSKNANAFLEKNRSNAKAIEFVTAYKKFIDWILGIGIYEKVNHLGDKVDTRKSILLGISQQLTFDQYVMLLEKYGKESVRNVFTDMANKIQSKNNYNTIYHTADNWIRRNKEKTSQYNKN